MDGFGAHLLGEFAANQVGAAGKADVFVVVAHFGFGGGGEEDFGQFFGFAQVG